MKSNLDVAWEVITPGSTLNRAIVAIPMHISSAAIARSSATAITLTPGTLTVDVHERRTGDRRLPTLYVHVLHFVDAESARRDVLPLERLAVAAFGDQAATSRRRPCRDEWARGATS